MERKGERARTHPVTLLSFLVMIVRQLTISEF